MNFKVKTLFIAVFVAGFLPTVCCKMWELKNTGLPIAQFLGSDKLWIVSDQAFSCLEMNSDFIWRVPSGEKIIHAAIVQGKGIVYLSRENGVSKVGLRFLENGNLKWETHVGNVNAFSYGDSIYLDDSTTLDFNGAITNEKGVGQDRKTQEVQVSKDALKIGQQKFDYNLADFGDPKLHEMNGRDLLVISESGLTLFYKDLKLVWTRDESLTQVLSSTFVKVGNEDIWVAVTKLGESYSLIKRNYSGVGCFNWNKTLEIVFQK
jgi:hypothetical protein